MSEEEETSPPRDTASVGGMNLSAVARLLMTSSTTVHVGETGEEERAEDPGRATPEPLPPQQPIPTPPTRTNTKTPPTTSSSSVTVTPATPVPDGTCERQADGIVSDSEMDIIVDDCPSPVDFTLLQSDLSPEGYDFPHLGYTTSGGYYRCRFCSFTTMTYTHLQLHMPKHGGKNPTCHKALKCSMCDYTTNDKSNFRRHKRLHNRTNPATVLRCGKCEFTTVLPRKIREHYCNDHDQEDGPLIPQIVTSASIVIPTYQDAQFNNNNGSTRHIDIGQGHCSSTGLGQGHCSSTALGQGHCSSTVLGQGHCASGALGQGHCSSAGLGQGHCTVTGVTVGSSGIHSLLAAGGHGPTVQFGRGNPLISNCVSQYTYNSQNHRAPGERTIASDYLRSIVSNILPAPRVPATSTITSSSFFLPQGRVESSERDPSPTGQQKTVTSNCPRGDRPDPRDIKFKSEPLDSDDVSDVSSSAIPLVIHSREIPRPMEAQTTQRLSIDIYDASHQDASAEDALSTNQAYADSARRKQHRSSSGANISIKCETSHIGVQCSLPVVKRETMETDNGRTNRNVATVFYNRGVQCELVAGSDSGDRDSHSSDTRCNHCGITFDDEVLFSIHIGCHSHTDPFVCNVCGKQCPNKYGFYSHIMRGHQC